LTWINPQQPNLGKDDLVMNASLGACVDFQLPIGPKTGVPIMSLGTILIIILIIFLIGGFSGRFGGYGYGFGHGGVGVIGTILIIIVVLVLLGRL
jgi:hypothetical protein